MSIESQFPDLNDGSVYFPSLGDEDRSSLHGAIGVLCERAEDDVLQSVRVVLGALNKEYAEQMCIPMDDYEAVIAHVKREKTLAKVAVTGEMIDMVSDRETLLTILNNLYPRKD